MGKHVIIVSSGAVGSGKKIFTERTTTKLPSQLTLVERQALSALGQAVLMNTYLRYFSQNNLLAAQVLVSPYDFQKHNHYENLKNTMEQLLEWKAIPIVNENDTVATEELRFGDNDQLAASITGMYHHSLLIILTSIDGFYIDNEKQDFIQKISPEIMEYAGDSSEGGMGGMRTKLIAAKKIISSGQAMSIVLGNEPQIIQKVLRAESIGTWFFQNSQQFTATQRWLLHRSQYDCIITVTKNFDLKKHDFLQIDDVLKYEGSVKTGLVGLIINEQSSNIAKVMITLEGVNNNLHMFGASSILANTEHFIFI